jgi:hypothetical protein
MPSLTSVSSVDASARAVPSCLRTVGKRLHPLPFVRPAGGVGESGANPSSRQVQGRRPARAGGHANAGMKLARNRAI